MTSQVYRIPVINYPRLQEEIEKLNKRAKKLKTEPIILTLLETITEKKRNDVVGFDFFESYHLCTVSGPAPKLEGWSLIAVVQPVPNGENLIREVPGQSCPAAFRGTNMHCDYCGKPRKRNAIYVLRHDNGDTKQVGHNCIADFLGHEHPESMLSRAEYMFAFDTLAREAQDQEWGFGTGPILVPTTKFTITAAVVIRKLGWLPKSKATEFERSTSQIVWDICTRPHERDVRTLIREKDIHADDGDVKRAEAAIKWAASIDPLKAPNNYLHDLGVCCRQNFVDHSRAGFVASVISAHQRVLSELQATKMPNLQSKHLGQIGVRQEFNDVVVIMASPYMAGLYNKTLIKFRDPDGNIILWGASGSPDWVEVGKKYTIKATVKKHSEFAGFPQTEVSRAEPIGLDVPASAE
jgi:hypothetical protein